MNSQMFKSPMTNMCRLWSSSGGFRMKLFSFETLQRFKFVTILAASGPHNSPPPTMRILALYFVPPPLKHLQHLMLPHGASGWLARHTKNKDVLATK